MDRSTNSILVTGASGFIGSAVMSALKARKFDPIGAFRCAPEGTAALDGYKVVGDLHETDWTGQLEGVDAIVHSAARVHVMDDTSKDPLSEFRKVNVDATLRLAREAAKAGVKRFIFLSSIKVNGEATEEGRPFTAGDVGAPTDPYGVSKYEAEQGLRRIASETGLEVVIIRPVLVYGPGVKANFLRMAVWLKKGIPLPLGVVTNRRSMVALDNLVDLILICVTHPAAANQIFLVSDGEDLSTTDLLRRTARALGKRARLLPVPPRLLQLGATIAGKPGVAQRLCGSLQVDISHTCDTLNWSPPVTVDQALKKTAEALER